jgi:hypothetical protein
MADTMQHAVVVSWHADICLGCVARARSRCTPTLDMPLVHQWLVGSKTDGQFPTLRDHSLPSGRLASHEALVMSRHDRESILSYFIGRRLCSVLLTTTTFVLKGHRRRRHCARAVLAWTGGGTKVDDATAYAGGATVKPVWIPHCAQSMRRRPPDGAGQNNATPAEQSFIGPMTAANRRPPCTCRIMRRKPSW